jgi:tRNA G18 (ribose-2'-O)-methylase SpoU
MVVARKPANGVWLAPEPLSGSQSVYYPALAMDAAGNLVAAWQVLDPGNLGSIWSSGSVAGGGWTPAVRLSTKGEDTAWPTAASARAGGFAVVSWTDNATNTVRTSTSNSGGSWKAASLGTGYWSGTVPVAAGGGNAVAGWATPHGFNPNAADLMADVWR